MEENKESEILNSETDAIEALRALTDTSSENVEEPNETILNADSIPCQNCYVKPRMSATALLCKDCDSENKQEIEENKKHALPVPERDAGTIERGTDNSNVTIRQFDFAVPSVRYSGQKLDEIVLAMLPDLPHELTAEITKASNEHARGLVVTNEPDLQDLMVRAAFYSRVGAILQQVVNETKLKLIAKAKPEFKRQQAEAKDNKKHAQIAAALPKEVALKHAAMVLLADFLEIVNVPADSDKAKLKTFLDYVQSQSMIDDITKEWLDKVLASAKYQSLNKYFKRK